MMRSLFSGVSGLQNQQTCMDVIGNNISNVNTVGFKASRVNFQDVLSQTLQDASSTNGTTGGTNPMQVGLGMGLASIDTLFNNGSFQPTGKQTDLSIQGQGFFILGSGANRVYTRAGNFDFDQQGNYLVPGNGLKVMGWQANNAGTINTAGTIQPIQIPIGAIMPPRVTTTATYEKTLTGDNNTIGSLTATSLDVYDSMGVSHGVNQTFVKNGNTSWLASTSLTDPTTGALTNTLREVTFNANGSLNTVKLATPNLPIPTVGPNITALQLNTTLNSSDNQYFTVFDTKGAPQEFKINFTNTSPTTWSYKVTNASDTAVNPTVYCSGVSTLGVPAAGQINFPSTAFTYGTDTYNLPAGAITPTLAAATAMTTAATYTTAADTTTTLTPTNGANPLVFALNMTALTQTNGESTAQATGQDGYGSGTLQSVSTDTSGTIIGKFSNGQSQNLAQVALAIFNNPGGLMKQGNNLYIQSNNSGVAQVGTSGSGGRGSLSPGSLEMSNVDLAQEFSNMIVTERGFQANSKIITTSDEMLQDLTNLKR